MAKPKKRLREAQYNSAAVEYLRAVKANATTETGKPITNAVLAERTGITEDTVTRLLLKTATFSLDQFFAVADALNISRDDAWSAVFSKKESE